MATPPNASAAKTVTDTDKAALTDAANQAFIADFIAAQTNAEALGQYQVFMTAAVPADVNYLAKYFQNLGYFITFPDFPQSQAFQPAELFGSDWIDFWTGQYIPTYLPPGQPIRLGIHWKNPTA